MQYRSKDKPTTDTTPAETQEITGEITDVRQRKGKTKNGKDYVMYAIVIGNEQYKTFHESHAKIAKEAMETGSPVTIKYTTDNYGHTIESIVAAEREPREPGEEG